ncbi:uncharacterized protein LOC127737230 isoform X2 [Mytilus californianus]|uniref:uncharacterized protein LOC127737230 isoform X2 n=1 Tax=Mytilus californianus TaxID=6549 RepID=UPI0022470D91|nr:uncharacterized protein LOC127737230 isoform X2 [Mytilus californianus]XP_052103744.1 uncharacterized protein LOC127737230 isoform X2 [Mytilus californianus]
MASSKPVPCGPCQEGKVKTKAEFWCYSCEEGLCSTCSVHHKRSKSSRDHKTIDIKNYKPSIRAIKTECDKHGQQLNLYCPSHLMPCCDECISTNHSKCMGIKSLASVVEKTKIDQSTQSLEKQINSIKHILEKMVANKSKNISRGEREYESIQDFIVKIRKDVNKHLTQLEKKLCNEAETILNQEKSKATDLITEIERTQKNLNKMQDHLHTVISQTSKLQSFLGVHQIEQQVHQYQQYVEDLENDGRTKEFDIKMKQNDEIEKILSKLELLESLGEVTSVKTDIDLNRETSVRRKAQVQSRQQSNINNMTINIETKNKINIEKIISGMTCLMDGGVIVHDQWCRSYLLTSDGKLQKKLPLPESTYSVTQINQNTIAISCSNEQKITFFNMENETVTKFIKLDKQCYGVSFSNDSLAVGLSSDVDDRIADDDEIRIIDLEGNTLMSILKVLNINDFVYCNDRVIFCDGKAVYCVDKSGKQIWQYTQDLSSPVGVYKDMYGNIIVKDNKPLRIIAISKDGQDSKVLICEEDGLMPFDKMCFKYNDPSGFIWDYKSTFLTKFHLSSE